MSEILFLAHRIPFPPDRGDRIRSSNLLRRIAALAPVHVGCLAEAGDDPAAVAELDVLAQSLCVAPRGSSLPVAGVRALVAGKPVSLAAFASPQLSRYVDDTLARRPISAIFVFSGQMAQYVPPKYPGIVVMDFVDVDSAKFEAYAAAARQPMRAIYQREARLLKVHEDRTARRASASLLVTPEERALFVERLSDPARALVNVLPNGIDAAFYDPTGIRPPVQMVDGGPQIVFTGQMDYPPNVAAVSRFAQDVMPRVRAACPHARFNIVGRAPTGAVRALDGRDGVRVTGEVPDVRPWLAGADLVVAPLEIARGVQNKVLEAMAMARPVLLTTPAATGIPAQAGRDFAIADGADALADQAIALLGERHVAEAMGAAARRFVLGHRAWDAVLAPLARLLDLDPEAGRHAA